MKKSHLFQQTVLTVKTKSLKCQKYLIQTKKKANNLLLGKFPNKKRHFIIQLIGLRF